MLTTVTTKVLFKERPNTYAIRNNGFSLRAIILLKNLPNTCPERLYRTHKYTMDKKDAEAANVNIQSGSAITAGRNDVRGRRHPDVPWKRKWKEKSVREKSI